MLQQNIKQTQYKSSNEHKTDYTSNGSFFILILPVTVHTIQRQTPLHFYLSLFRHFYRIPLPLYYPTLYFSPLLPVLFPAYQFLLSSLFYFYLDLDSIHSFYKSIFLRLIYILNHLHYVPNILMLIDYILRCFVNI